MRNIKITLAIIAVVQVIVLLGGCDSKIVERNNIEEINIGVTLYNQNDIFISTIAEGIVDIGKDKELEKNIKINFNIMDSKGSTINEEKHIERFINQQYDVICINLVDRTAASSIIDKAKEAKIPIVFFNREPVEEDMKRWNNVFYVGTDAKQAGQMQGEIILDIYNKDKKLVDKNKDGKIQYVILEGEPGHQDTDIRTEYCIKTLVDFGIEVEKLASEVANWKSNEANNKMNKFINEFGNSIEVVFSNNDEMALGIINAYDNNGITNSERPLIVGIDGIPQAIEAIKNGTMLGTVISDSKAQAQIIFNTAYNLVMYDEYEESDDFYTSRYIKVSHEKLTKHNIN